jgi:L-lysine 2,3-aminomutase
MVHFNHPRELTGLALSKLDECLQNGLSVTNQTPLLRGINDNPVILSELFNRLATAGVPPYYLFHCRPTQGNESFQLSVQAGMAIVNEAKKQLSGLARRFRYVASHRSGKLEIVGQVDKQLIFSYHEAKTPQDEGRLLRWPAEKEIFWFDEVVDYQ